MVERWKIEVLEASDAKFDLNVTRCRYAEMYKEMGLDERWLRHAPSTSEPAARQD
jgi:hypothetical protein